MVLRKCYKSSSVDCAAKHWNVMTSVLSICLFCNTFLLCAQGIEYCFITVRIEGKPAAHVLAEELPSLLKSLSFAKSMRWHPHGENSFSRPLRWLLALHGSAKVPFAFGGLVAGRSTRLLRASEQPTATLTDAREYAQVMQDAGIVVDAMERQDQIWQAVEAAAQACFCCGCTLCRCVQNRKNCLCCSLPISSN
jgi:hypothetical protein